MYKENRKKCLYGFRELFAWLCFVLSEHHQMDEYVDLKKPKLQNEQKFRIYGFFCTYIVKSYCFFFFVCGKFQAKFWSLSGGTTLATRKTNFMFFLYHFFNLMWFFSNYKFLLRIRTIAASLYRALV